MAFFKFRLPGQNTAEAQGNFSNPPTESVEALRRRARHRLIGATVLVLIGVVGFPMVFDTQPRPVSADITIDIPDRAKAVASGAITPAPQPLQTAATLDPKEEVVKADKPETSSAASSVAAVAAGTAAAVATNSSSVTTSASTPSNQAGAANNLAGKADAAAPAKVEAPKPDAVKAEATKADSAKSENTKAESAKHDDTHKEGAGRFVVQVGAFSEEAKVRELRSKVEKAGLKTYTQEAATKEGKRIRVRVGPFTSREDADKAAAKLKQLNLQPQVLSL
jgi:DedD protein